MGEMLSFQAGSLRKDKAATTPLFKQTVVRLPCWGGKKKCGSGREKVVGF